MKELVVISGKGGTGKTSITASFAALADNLVMADCDVDASDLHLIFVPRIREHHEFRGGHEAIIRSDYCTGCGLCRSYCRFDAVGMKEDGSGVCRYFIDPYACEGCGVCVRFCPEKAIDFTERICGEWIISDTRCGSMVHARLGTGAENSGKLVSIVRNEARGLAEKNNHSMVIVDGPPGIGCPVIASITGATFVLIVTEPTVSGEHDMKRVLDLAGHFKIPAAVCVNKWDINPEMTVRIETHAVEANAKVFGRIRYDTAVNMAQIQQKTAVEIGSPCGDDIRNIWNQVKGAM